MLAHVWSLKRSILVPKWVNTNQGNVRMKSLKLKFGIVVAASLSMAAQSEAAVDPNFYVFLAFGQSNMEGYANQPGDITAADKVSLPRFQVMGATTCSGLQRTKDQWSPGIAPLFRCNTGLSPVDYFARTLVDSLPATIKIGIVPVAVAGTPIKGFMPNGVGKAYYAGVTGDDAYMKPIANEYGGDPYARLVAMGKLAQQSGVIKGILLHQGESDGFKSNWGDSVKIIYNSLLTDLNVNAADVPFLAGQVYNGDGTHDGTNAGINGLPKIIPTAYVISSSGLSLHTADKWKVHFSADAYRTFGKRYAIEMLKHIPRTPAGVTSKPSVLTANADFVVYDLKGVRVGGFHATDLASVETGWVGASKTLPNGIYWMRNTSTGNSYKVIAGR